MPQALQEMGQTFQEGRLCLNSMQSNLEPISFSRLQLLSGLLALCIFQQAVGAEAAIEEQLASTRAVVQELDRMAGNCLNSSEALSVNSACQDFNEALNGDMLASYIENCQQAKAWREEFVSNQSQSDKQVVDTGESLEKMVAIEYLCGEDALLKRTEFVALAYQRINNPGAAALSANENNNRQYRELRQELLLSRERNQLLQTFQQQQQRQRSETQRQFDQRELELIRQQNNPLHHR